MSSIACPQCKTPLSLVLAAPPAPPGPTPPLVLPPVAAVSANVALWKSKAIEFGKIHAANLAINRDKPLNDSILNSTYYDATRVFFNLYDVFGDKIWKEAAHDAFHIYVDNYVLPNGGNVPAHYMFPHGIVRHAVEFPDEAMAAHKAILLMADQQYANWQSPEQYLYRAEMRILAYSAGALLPTFQGPDQGWRGSDINDKRYLHFEGLVARLLTYMLEYVSFGHLPPFQPFMGSLAVEALIDRHNWISTGVLGDGLTIDPRTLPAIKSIADYTWNRCWLPDAKAFKYCDQDYTYPSGETCSQVPAPDLNLMVILPFGWLFKMTGDLAYKRCGDLAFNGGVTNGYWAGDKQYNQLMRTSKLYLELTGQL